MPKLTAPVVPAGSMGLHRQPRLHSGDLLLRPWQMADVAALVAAYSDPAIQRWHVQSMTTPEARAFVTAANAGWVSETAANWAVIRTGGVVGRMSVRSIDLTAGVAAIAYWVMPEARGHGVALRALRVASTWALTDLGLHRLELEHSVANEASCRVAERAGYPPEGTRRRHGLHSDGWHDMHVHVRLDDDPLEPPSPNSGLSAKARGCASDATNS